MTKYYECESCGKRFEHPHIWETTYENYYGAPVPTHTPLNIEICPSCKSEDIEQKEEDEDVDH